MLCVGAKDIPTKKAQPSCGRGDQVYVAQQAHMEAGYGCISALVAGRPRYAVMVVGGVGPRLSLSQYSWI